ncbi:MAG: sulfatase [Planctomycetota bacterium]|jgi:arylsulfatase A-like enzyme
MILLLPLPWVVAGVDIAIAKSDARRPGKTGVQLNSPAANQPKACDRPNVLMIAVETLRADHVGCLGYLRNTTPTLDGLAKQGVVFSRAMATSSWTMPTIMSVFTSLYPGLHGMTDWAKQLPAGTTTLAHVLKANGYITAAFVSNPALDGDCGFDRGFDLYDDFSVRLSLRSGLFGDSGRISTNIYDGALTNDLVNRLAINWLQKNHSCRFFMFVFYFDAHHDYIPPPPYDTMFDPNYDGAIDGRGIRSQPRRSTRPPPRDLQHIIALYDGEIRYTDYCISQLLDKFRECQILDRTLVIVFGDHGDEFYEHGSTSHAFTLYNEVLNIPLILSWPGTIAPDQRIDALVGQVDIMPTILDYLGIEYKALMQGVSLRPVIENRRPKVHDLVYAEVAVEETKVFAAAIGNRYKLILDLQKPGPQLFDLSKDPAEQHNIYPAQPSATNVPLRRQLTAWLAHNSTLSQRFSNREHLIEGPLHQQRLRQLRALGYAQ